MIKLSERLQIIHDMVPKSVVADIGSDHGKLMVALVESKTITKGYAVENKEGPFERLRNNLIRYHVSDKITPLFSDGIKDITRDVSTIVIAGMGGQTIVNILKAKLILRNSLESTQSSSMRIPLCHLLEKKYAKWVLQSQMKKSLKKMIFSTKLSNS